jgi:hypothetical protein
MVTLAFLPWRQFDRHQTKDGLNQEAPKIGVGPSHSPPAPSNSPGQGLLGAKPFYDRAAIQGIERVLQLDTQRLVAVQGQRLSDQNLSQFLEHSKIASFVRLGQGGACHAMANARVIEALALSVMGSGIKEEPASAGFCFERSARGLDCYMDCQIAHPAEMD